MDKYKSISAPSVKRGKNVVTLSGARICMMYEDREPLLSSVRGVCLKHDNVYRYIKLSRPDIDNALMAKMFAKLSTKEKERERDRERKRKIESEREREIIHISRIFFNKNVF